MALNPEDSKALEAILPFSSTETRTDNSVVNLSSDVVAKIQTPSKQILALNQSSTKKNTKKAALSFNRARIIFCNKISRSLILYDFLGHSYSEFYLYNCGWKFRSYWAANHDKLL